VTDELNNGAPPTGEQVHMPAPSIIPLINAAALALTIVSLTLNHIITVVAGIIFLITVVIWIRDTRRDIADLPLDHSSH
jgi:Flp pilus assembly protein TadB